MRGPLHPGQDRQPAILPEKCFVLIQVFTPVVAMQSC
jgi:hypothetical protein